MLPHTTLSVQGIPLDISGQGNSTILMLHGWPDTAAVWDAQVAALAPHYRTVRFTLPGFLPGSPRCYPSLDDLIALLDDIIAALGDQPVTLLLHDWGCFIGYHYAASRPDKVRAIAAIDVGDTRSAASEWSFGAKMVVLAYQLSLALAWRLPSRAGDGLTRLVARVLRVPRSGKDLHAGMNYPYHRVWLAGRARWKPLARVEPHCPMFFAWGTRKPFMFHAQRWIDRLRQNPANRAEGFKAGHWVMQDAAKAYNHALLNWLSSLDTPH